VILSTRFRFACLRVLELLSDREFEISLRYLFYGLFLFIDRVDSKLELKLTPSLPHPPFPLPPSSMFSVLVGPAAFIKKAKHFRKLFGGGVRQSGGLAASADFALTHNFPQLKRTHVLAKRLSDALKALGARMLVEAETSIVSKLSYLSTLFHTSSFRRID